LNRRRFHAGSHHGRGECNRRTVDGDGNGDDNGDGDSNGTRPNRWDIRSDGMGFFCYG
jgi:hypothetical protein